MKQLGADTFILAACKHSRKVISKTNLLCCILPPSKMQITYVSFTLWDSHRYSNVLKP